MGVKDIPLAALAYALAAVALLAACQSTPVPVSVCPPVKTYSKAEQAALGAALAAIPDSSPLALAMTDYGRLRDAARACAGARP